MTDDGSGPTRIIDAHMHQWDPRTTPRDWRLTLNPLVHVPPLLDLAFKFVSRSDRESIADPAYLVNPYLLAEYRSDTVGLPIDTVVHVDSGWHGRGDLAPADETKWVAGLPFGDHAPRLGAIMGAADPSSLHFGPVLDAHLGASPLFRGIRCLAAHHQDKGVRSWTRENRLLVQPRFLDGFGKLAERDLIFETWVYSHDLPDVAELARRFPDTTIVLDHAGTPAGVLGPVGRNTGRSESERRGLFDAWRDDLAAVAQHSNVVVKLSGLTLPVLGHQLPLRGRSVPVTELVTRVQPLAEHVIDVFGSSRAMWGSNSPLEKPVSTLVGNVSTMVEILQKRGSAAVADVFAGTAAQIYRITP
jgi:L-fuconolactonase